ncbi:FMN-dependent NADPH-azoreductase [Streptomyces sp. ADI92-24]|uniref:NADPH-dependent FMN reductase n=1 Tax=unclassified Streptomyces TaxID=2593676 RepID=UPI000F48B44F|nr:MULTISPECIES: NAD(P)H-dependent oxidoreductase [unclassified Streptomyces]MCX4772726.1 NAD(P)H-dependent oxidoreductase [Streptomyces sp. NBC_01285]ROQ71300.1 NAD(P)H-dependent FMN reductase [Streptomyces sp. CEV 2-1]RPK51534.1 FMN-dependent NADPH-azoreductase [Streptomyces sp. ADI92-24]
MDLATAESTATATATAAVAATAATASGDAPLKVAVILASNREGRFAPVVADWFLSRTDGHPAVVTDLVDVAGLDLPTVHSYRPGSEVRDRLAEVAGRLAAADAFVVVTPEYNHSYPAPLKNLIDWHFTEWQAKPVAFVSYGGVSGGLRAVEHLRQVFAELHAVSIRDTVSFHNAGALFDDEGRHRDPAGPDAAAKSLLDQLVWWGRALRDAKEVRPYGG